MNRIKELREQQGMSQTQLAKYIGVARSTMSQYESDARQVSDDTKIKLADYFNVSIDYLIGRDIELLHIPDNLKGIPVAFHNGIEDLSQDDIDDVAKFIEFLKAKNKK